ncbi:MAG: hypothetical protein M1833_005780 [Piccolia ochrophora]|nr:MAG: hypothetical protein M1833_005780 [Piccolia ochrophora]
MHFSTLTPLLALLSLTTTHALPQDSSPADAAGKPAPPPCIVPLVLYTSLPNPFTLTALLPSTSWPVQTSPRTPSKTRSSKLVISNKRIAQPNFKLADGKLVYEGFDAQTLPSPAIFPPPLVSLVFGGSGPTGGQTFSAGYACDAKGKQYLKLIPDGFPFVVPRVAEGQELFLKPKDFQGKSVEANLKIQGGL